MSEDVEVITEQAEDEIVTRIVVGEEEDLGEVVAFLDLGVDKRFILEVIPDEMKEHEFTEKWRTIAEDRDLEFVDELAGVSDED